MIVGPIRTVRDLVAVRDWILRGRFDPADLPDQLTGLQRSVRAAVRN
jgi:hypothetical protein